MSSRDIHSRDGGQKVRDLLSSFFITLLLKPINDSPLYLISPWLTDFKLMDNSLGQFKDLFKMQTSLSESPHILFSEAIIEVSSYLPVRVVTWPDVHSTKFVKNFEDIRNIEIKFEESEKDHQKGLLTDLFYFEGSMNFTYGGTYVNKEKITCNASYYTDGKKKITEAYFEFDRIWENLK